MRCGQCKAQGRDITPTMVRVCYDRSNPWTCEDILAEQAADDERTCTICDGLGHGYPGAGPCPLEERGGPDMDRYEEAMVNVGWLYA
jgi:hypothetical protein